MASAAVMFSACSNDELTMKGGNTVNDTEQAKQTITLAVANTGDNFLGTRAEESNRHLYSTEAKQKIDIVKVVIYKLGSYSEEADDLNKAIEAAQWGENMEVVASKTITSWMTGGVSNEYNSSKGHGRQASWTLSTSEAITKAGKYVAYAVGYNYNDYEALKTFNDSESNTYTFPLTVEHTGTDVKEVFAGSTVFDVSEKEIEIKKGETTETVKAYEFNASLTLHRQVAGILGYFKNIPVKGNADHADQTGSKLRLVAANKSTKAVFAGFNSDFIEAGNNVQYMVNGYKKSDNYDALFYCDDQEKQEKMNAYKVYEIDLADWFTPSEGGELDTNGDGILNENDDNWHNPLRSETETMRVKAGTVIAGKFLFPFAQVADTPTLQLQLIGEKEGKEEIIRIWNIRLPKSDESTDSQIGKTITTVNEKGVQKKGDAVESNINYSIVRNHLYSIGKRNAGDNPDPADPTDPEEPEDPDAPVDPGNGDDKPQDLNNENLILRVNDNWEMIHDMEID